MNQISLRLIKQEAFKFDLVAGPTYNLTVYKTSGNEFFDLTPANDYTIPANSLTGGRHSYSISTAGQMIQFGMFEVEDVVTLIQSDPISILRKKLETIEAKITQRIETDQAMFTVEDHSIQREQLETLRKERARVIRELNMRIKREKASRGEAVSFFKSIKIKGGF